MNKIGQVQEEDNNKKATLMSLTVHILIGALFFMPIGHVVKNIENAQIQVELPPKDLLGGGPALGLPNQGSGSNPAPGKPDPNAGNSASKPTPVPEPLPPVKSAPPKPVFSKPTPPTTPPRKVETTEDPNAAVIRRQAEQARQRAEEAKYQAESAARAKRQQEDAARAAEAQRQAQAQEAARAAQAAKDKFKGKFGNGSGSGTNGGEGTGTGRGNTGRPGSQGSPDGDPNSQVLSGLGRGAGTVNGFGGRGVRSAPKLDENSQKQGKVVLKVCVDADGNVSSADYSAVGSNSNDGDLIDAAKRNARQYKFAAGNVDKQCGTITYNFIVK
jgi:outer membrane biosynthesis protein TonB